MTRRYLLDTGPASDVLFRRKGAHLRVQDLRRRGVRVGIGLPVMAEIAAGLDMSASRDASWAIAKRNLNTFVLWPFDKPAALEFGRIQAELKRAGRPMQSIDVMIAAIVRSLGSCTLATKDSDLFAVPGLTVEDWSNLPEAQP